MASMIIFSKNQLNKSYMQSIVSSKTLFNDITLIRQTNPIVHNVTNLVVMQTTANVLLALGASPIMAHAANELLEISKLASALVINIGTLDDSWINAITTAQKNSLQKKIPVVFDPVGAGATSYRTDTAKKILNSGVDILRGNASEIMALVDTKIVTKGVDSQHQSETAIGAARALAEKYHCTVVISGATDIVVDPYREIYITHGTPLFTKVTGMGCSATALIGAFAAVNADYFLAATHAMSAFTIAGEIAAKKANGPGSFHIALLDALFLLKEPDFANLNIK